MLPRLALVPGEPAGIGPELCVRLAQQPRTDCTLLAFADPATLISAAATLGLPLRLIDEDAVAKLPGDLRVRPVPNASPTTFGHTDPRNARAVIEALTKAAGACLIGDVVGLFHKYVVPPALTAALWRVLATDPTITYLGPVRDRLGRPAEAFSTPGEDGVSQRLLLIAPGTGAYLGEEVVLIAPSPSFDFQPPAVTSFSALVHSERVAPDHPAELG